jgi:hypothetical protein
MRVNLSAATGAAYAANASTTRYVGKFYIRFTTLPTVSCELAYHGSTAATGPKVWFNQSDSKIYARVGSTSGASGVTVTTGVWYRIDFDFNIQTAGNDVCDVQVDGSACGQATATGLSAGTGNLGLGSLTATTCDMFYDDVILSQTAGDYPLGAGYVNHFTPTSDGTHNIAGAADFQRTTTGTDILNATTTAFQLIDDVPLESGSSVDWINMVAPPNATDYVECIFGPAPGVNTPTAAPRAVTPIAAQHQAGTGTGNTRIAISDNGTLGLIYNATAAGTTTIVYKWVDFSDPPSAASVWVIGGGGNGDFTNLRVRFGSPGAVDANPDQYLDSIMVEAEFAGSGVQAVTNGTITSTATLFAPTVHYVVSETIASSLQLFAAALTLVATTGTIASGSQAFEPSVAYAVTASTVASTSQIFSPTSTYVIDGGTVAATSQLFEPTISTATAVEGGTVASTSTLFSPTVAYAVTTDTIASTSTLFAPTTTYVVTGDTVASTAQLFVPTATYVVEGGTVASTSTLFNPTIAYVSTTSTIASTASLFSPTVISDQAITGGTVASTVQTFSPTTSYVIDGGTVASSAALFSPTATYEVTAGTVASSAQPFTPTVQYEVTTGTVAATSQVFEPTVGYEVTTGTVASTETLFTPSVVLSATTGTISSTSALFEPSVVSAGSIIGGTIAAGSQLFSSTTAYVVIGPTAGSTELLRQDCEGAGTPAGWADAGTGTVDWDEASVVGEASQSLRLVTTSNQARSFASITAKSTVYLHFMWRWNALGGTLDFFRLRSSGGNRLQVRADSNGTLSVVHGTSVSTPITDDVPQNTWVHVWARYVQGTGTNGYADLEWSTSSTRTGSGTKFTSLSNGTSTSTVNEVGPGVTANETMTVYFDQIIVDYQYYPDPAVAAPVQVFAPSVAPVVTADTVASTATLFAPTATYVATTSTIAAGSVLFEPTVATEGSVVTGTVASTEQTFAPSVTLVSTTGTVDTTVQMFAPTVAEAQQDITGGTVAAGSQTFQPEVTQTATGSTVASTVALFEPSLALEITVGTVSSTLELYPPTVTATSLVTTAFISSGSQLFAPSLLALQFVTTGTISSGSQLDAPFAGRIDYPPVVFVTVSSAQVTVMGGSVTPLEQGTAPATSILVTPLLLIGGSVRDDW